MTRNFLVVIYPPDEFCECDIPATVKRLYPKRWRWGRGPAYVYVVVVDDPEPSEVAPTRSPQGFVAVALSNALNALREGIQIVVVEIATGAFTGKHLVGVLPQTAWTALEALGVNSSGPTAPTQLTAAIGEAARALEAKQAAAAGEPLEDEDEAPKDGGTS